MDPLKALFSIVIVCIDHQERTVNQPLYHQNSLTGSPGFFAALRHKIALWKSVQLLIGINNRDLLGNAVSDNLLKILFQIFTDNKYDFVKSGLNGVMDRIIHNNLSIWPNRSQLLDSAPKPAADSSRHNY